MPEARITLRRPTDPPVPGARRILVDRIWPRGVKKERLAADLWMRALAPSDELRTWFAHRPDRWEEFRRRYRRELAEPERAQLLAEVARLAGEGPVTLLYGARDRAHNQAVVIAEALEELGG